MTRVVGLSSADLEDGLEHCSFVVRDSCGEVRPCARMARHGYLFCGQHHDHVAAAFDAREWRARGRRGDSSELDVLRARLADAEARARTPEPEVYYIERPADGLIKIGYSTRVEGRMASLGRRADALRILATEPGGPQVERLRHEQFDSARVTGEWFRPTATLLRHIGKLQAIQERMVLPPAGERAR